MENWIIILATIVLLGVCPLFGRFLYNIENKITFIIYIIVSIVIAILIFVITEHLPWSLIIKNWKNYILKIIKFKTLFIFTLFTYILAGIGVIGGILEYMGEQTESAEAYKQYKKLSVVKLYFYYLVYGYVFLFAIFSLSQFLISLLGWNFENSSIVFQEVFTYIQFHNLIFAILGILLFSLKTYKFGFISGEFYRSEYHPSLTQAGFKLKLMRKFISLLILALGIYCIILMYLFETYPPNNGTEINLEIGKSFFFFAATVQTLLFYLLKEKYVDQLKPLKKQYELKVGIGPDKETLNEDDSDLKYDD